MTRRSLPRPAVASALVVLLVGVLAVGGCKDGEDAAPGAGASSPGAAGAARPGASADGQTFPGLYLTSDVRAIPQTPRQLKLISRLPCTQVRDVVAAGQWRVADRMNLKDSDLLTIGGHPVGDLLRRGDDLAFAAYSGTDACTATVSVVARTPIALEGAGLPGKTTGWVATTRCSADKDRNISMNVYFDTDAGTGGMVALELTRSGAGYQLRTDDSDAFSAALFTHPGGILETISRGLELPPDATLPGVVGHEALPGEGFAGSIDLDAGSADKLPSGKLTVSGLGADDGTRDIALTLSFACNSVTG